MNPRDLSRPHHFEKRGERTLLLLHGTGGDEFDLVRLGEMLDSSASILSPRGLWVENGMNRFFERYPDGSFNEESVKLAAEEIRDFVLAACTEHNLEASKVVAVGFSNGANTAAALLALYPEVLEGAVLFGSTKPLNDIVEPPSLSGRRVWIANGDQDPYAPVAITENWVAELKRYGAEVKWLRHGGGHQISPVHIQEISSDLT